MIRLGVLGAGAHSTIHHGPSLRAYAKRYPGVVELAAVCDLDQSRAETYAREFGFQTVYTDLEIMLAEAGLDGVVAITPVDLTEELAGRVLRSGIPVVIEKPPGVGVEGAVRLLEIGRLTDTRHMISFNRRFSPAFARALSWLRESGHRVELIASRMLRHRRTEPFFVRDTGLHCIDAVLSVTGAPARIDTQVRDLPFSKAHFSEARMRAKSGVTTTFAFAPDAGLCEETMELLGEGFRIWVDFGQGQVTIHQGMELALEWQAPKAMEEFEISGSFDETASFIRALSENCDMGPTLADALVTMQASVAIQKGGTMEFPGDG